MAEIAINFDATTQSLSALNVAAYRLIGTAACQTEQIGARYICRLTPTAQMDSEGVRLRFLNLVTDENVREGLRVKTEPLRNLILSLAFGSVAVQSQDKS